MPSPPSPQSDHYKDMAKNHVARRGSEIFFQSTPFISTTRSLIRALSFCYKATSSSSIAVIDLHKAGRSDEFEDESNPYIQEVLSLNFNSGDRPTRIRKVKKSYSGRGEVRKYLQAKDSIK